MEYTNWSIYSLNHETGKKRQSQNALFTVGNGYFGIRGFYEEDTASEAGNGGIYLAGVRSNSELGGRLFEDKRRDLCNIMNILRLHIIVDGKQINGVDNITNYRRELDMQGAVYTRCYRYDDCLDITLSRFADMVDVHRVRQDATLVADKDMELTFRALIDSDVHNLNLISREPDPVQPGLNHILSREIGTDSIVTLIDSEDDNHIFAAGQTVLTVNGVAVDGSVYTNDFVSGREWNLKLKTGDKVELRKIVAVYTDNDGTDSAQKIDEFLTSEINWDEIDAAHKNRWAERWANCDIEVDSNTDDQTALRFDLFELMCVCPTHTDRVSIGARGLAGEQYEGCVFWDNEIFQLPFFTFTDPESSRRMLAWRYHGLDVARRYAKYNWFEGAMYPWQACEKCREQTPIGGGGYYSIHIISDIAYAIRQYFLATQDSEFMFEMGAEVLMETARFWASRADYSEWDGYWHINTVRGPNEYDFYVNDNAYTNTMAALNLRTAKEILTKMETEAPEKFAKLCTKTNFSFAETEKWLAIADGLYICYDEKRKLIAEDSNYFNRRFLDMKKAKPTAKRIVDSTMNHEWLPFYQVTKQSDVATLMCLLPEKFSEAEKIAAYDFYEPRTAHDSSLSYAPYAWLGARIGKDEQAYEYFKNCAYLDIADLKLNTISGLHFANFGGTWQVAVFGFGGASFTDGKLTVDPKLPKEWNGMTYHLVYRGVNIEVKVTKTDVTVAVQGGSLPVCIAGNDTVLSDENSTITVKM